MPEHIRALIAILFISTFVFYYAQKAIGPMLLPKEFSRWRNAWLAVTLLAFISQNFWLFIILCSLFLLYMAKSEQNKFALYFAIILAIPIISARIPGLFDINYARLLSLTLLLPIFISLKKNPDAPSLGKPLAEKFLLAYLLLNIILLMRGTTFTDSLRYGFYTFTDYFLPYYAASRAIKDFDQLKKVMIAFVLACLLVGAIGAFEFKKSWLLYSALTDSLHADWDMGTYLGRGSSLRALASLGHSAVLGFIMMVGLGFYLFIAKSIKSNMLRLTGLGLIVAGLISALTRGSWVGTAILLLVFTAFGPKIIRRFSLLGISTIIAIQALYWIPGGEKVINLMPFVGKVDKSNVDYREKLIDKSILVIQKYPLFGVFDARQEPEMEDMVQGQGIIDIVNTYLGVALGMGLVGLSLFLGFFALVLMNLRKSLKRIVDKKSEEYLCGRSLLATMSAVLFTIFTVSSIGILPNIYWALAGLIFSYGRVTNLARNNEAGKIVVQNPVYPTYRLKSDA
ncbi:MAG: O-antigen ligase family protein [Methylotenera sp.]